MKLPSIIYNKINTCVCVCVHARVCMHTANINSELNTDLGIVQSKIALKIVL